MRFQDPATGDDGGDDASDADDDARRGTDNEEGSGAVTGDEELDGEELDAEPSDPEPSVELGSSSGARDARPVAVVEAPPTNRMNFIEGGILIEDSPAGDPHGNEQLLSANMEKLRRMQQLRYQMQKTKLALQKHLVCMKISTDMLLYIYIYVHVYTSYA